MSGITGPGDIFNPAPRERMPVKMAKLPQKTADEIVKQLDTITEKILADCLSESYDKKIEITLAYIRYKTNIVILYMLNSKDCEPEYPLHYLEKADKRKINLMLDYLSNSIFEEYLNLYHLKPKTTPALLGPTPDKSNIKEPWLSEIKKILSKIEIPAPDVRTAKPKRGKTRGKLSQFREQAGLSRPGVSYIKTEKMKIPVETRVLIQLDIALFIQDIWKNIKAGNIERDFLYVTVREFLYKEINSGRSNLSLLKNCTRAEKDKLAEYITDAVKDILRAKIYVDADVRLGFKTEAEWQKYLTAEVAKIHQKIFDPYTEKIDKLLSNIEIKIRVPATGTKLRRRRAKRAGVDFEKLFKAKRAGKTIKVKIPPKAPKVPKPPRM